MKRTLTVAVTLLVACSVLAPATLSTHASANQHEIASCTVVDEPGDYELTEDIHTNETGSCLEIQANDVSIDGNGHVLEGPGINTDSNGIDLSSGNYSSDVTVQNVEITGWNNAIYAGGSYELSNTALYGNGAALKLTEGKADRLTDVAIENNSVGISAIVGSATGSNVTIQENEQGIYAVDGGVYEFDSSRIHNNEEVGVQVGHHSNLNLTDSTVTENGDHGIIKADSIGQDQLYVEDSTVANNGGDGIRLRGPNSVQLTNVSVEGNDGLEVNAQVDEDFGTPINASNLHVGPSATTHFQNEPLTLDSIPSENLPARADGSPAGDGLEVGGDVTGPIHLELDVDTDDDTVDLWRYDGSDWETVEENLSVTDGSIETSVDRNGTYAPGTAGESSDSNNDQEDNSDGTGDDADDSEDDSEQSDDSQDDSDDESKEADDSQDGSEDNSDPSDKDGEKDTPTPTETPSDGSSSNCGCSTADDSDDPNGTNESTPVGETTASPESDHQQSRENGTDVSGDNGSQPDEDETDESLADGPGFTAIGALVALLAIVLLVRRRQ